MNIVSKLTIVSDVTENHGFLNAFASEPKLSIVYDAPAQ
jgi:hypothetical protein